MSGAEEIRASALRNGPDPTANVLLVVSDAVARLDDLREAETRRVNEMLALRAECGNDLRKAETRRVDEQILLRVEYNKLLTEAEAKRIDAIRSVDAAAVGTATDRATAQAQVLANQVVTSAETLRTLVATTAATVAAQLAQLSTQLTDRITSLERSQYEGKGRSGISAPLLMLIATGVGGIIVFVLQTLLSKG